MTMIQTTKLGVLSCALILSACTAIPNRDLRTQYLEMTRQLGLTPVYPPREEFNVGDVYFVSGDDSKPDDTSQTVRIWLGTIDDVRSQANRYMRSRINLEDTVAASNVLTTGGQQKDFEAGTMTLNEDARKTLPLVTFPTVTGAASSDGALGSFGFTNAIGFNFGSSETVSIDFTDTRAFGAPIGATKMTTTLRDEYLSKICSRKNIFVPTAQNLGAQKQIDISTMCSKGRSCSFAVITRTYTTRQIQYRYTSARIARLAAARSSGPSGADETTPQLPTSVDINLTVTGKNSAEELAKIANALQSSVSNPNNTAEFNGLNFVGFQGNALAFSRVFQKPVRTKQVSVTLTPEELQGFDEVLARHGIESRSAGVRCLIQSANGIFQPDPHLSEELRSFRAALNRVGNNVTQIAKRLNEARAKGMSPGIQYIRAFGVC